jgi:hypothetical protein
MHFADDSHTEHPLELCEVLNGMNSSDTAWDDMVPQYVGPSIDLIGQSLTLRAQCPECHCSSSG